MRKYLLISSLLICAPPLSADEMNLATCLLGHYADLCNHEILTTEEAKKVKLAEYKVNYDVCWKVLHSSECNQNLLTDADYSKIQNKYSTRPTNELANSVRFISTVSETRGSPTGGSVVRFPDRMMNTKTGQTVRYFRRSEVPDGYDGDYVIVDQNQSYSSNQQGTGRYGSNRNTNYYSVPPIGHYSSGSNFRNRTSTRYRSNLERGASSPDNIYQYGYNRLYDQDQKEGFESSFGTRYKYDLSDPVDQIMYEVDLEAQLRDSIDINPMRDLERGIGEYGGGVLDDQ